MNKLIALVFIFLGMACQRPVNRNADDNFISEKNESEHKSIILIIQPFEGFPKNYQDTMLQQLKTYFDTIQLNTPIALPQNAWYAPNKRYKADSIIDFLAARSPAGAVTIGMTHHDISTKKGKIMDYGIMGLGFQPGKACVVSYFRLSKKNTQEQFLKLCLHELGHTQGLPHCPNANCFMRDAKGKNHADEEKEFCNSCKKFLVSKGWKL